VARRRLAATSTFIDEWTESQRTYMRGA
jgi:hypothetical protein